MIQPLLALVGPTACGKTEAGIEIARTLGAEIVSVDSMLLYRGMDIGTAKPTPKERARVAHHLVDVAEPAEAFSVARYQELARAAIADIRGRGRRVLLVGGSGLYFRAAVGDLEFPTTDPAIRDALEAEALQVGEEALHARLAASDPVAAARIEPSNLRRTVRALEVSAATGRPFSSYAAAWERFPDAAVRAAGVEVSREALDARIAARVRAMVDGGVLEEVRALLANGDVGRITSGQAIGYAAFADVLRGERSIEDAIAATVKRTRALARRQMAWFRRDPRIRWFRSDDGATAVVPEILDHLRG
ncbi:MAG: tRNA (adenosine(37)-N6)-dimethylallyltransferase MiaA [Actinomycetota bacterium]